MSTSTTLTKLTIAAATASGDDGNVPANVLDGNTATRWSSFGKGQWIRLDLGSVQTVGQLQVAWYRADQPRQYLYVILTSTDGQTFVTDGHGQSAGGSLAPEKYNISPALQARYVQVTVSGSNINDWASITEMSVYGSAGGAAAAPPSPSPQPSTNLDPNGIKMIYPTAATDRSYYYQVGGPDNIESGSKCINTDRNAGKVMTEGAVKFVRLTCNTVNYASGMASGKTARVNLNAGGFIATQVHNWKDANVTYLWTPGDSKNAEFTYIYRAVNKVHDHTTTGSKMRSGIHSGSVDPRASCFDIEYKIGAGDSSLEYALEYNHPNYHYSGTTKKSSNLSQPDRWIGRKTICWTVKDGSKVVVEDYVDWNPLDAQGKPANNWVLLQTVDIKGDSTYNKVPTWGGMFTLRQDGFEYVDIAAISLREITPPT